MGTKGQIDYTEFKMCRRCDKKKWPRIFLRCPDCGYKLHTRKRNKTRGSPYERKYIE